METYLPESPTTTTTSLADASPSSSSSPANSLPQSFSPPSQALDFDRLGTSAPTSTFPPYHQQQDARLQHQPHTTNSSHHPYRQRPSQQQQPTPSTERKPRPPPLKPPIKQERHRSHSLRLPSPTLTSVPLTARSNTSYSLTGFPSPSIALSPSVPASPAFSERNLHPSHHPHHISSSLKDSSRPASPLAIASATLQKSLWTLDAKVMAREMERFAELQDDAWQSLCVKVLPLFNGEGIKGSIEDLNNLVRRSMTDPISPSLFDDVDDLLRNGMFTLSAKLFGVNDEKLVSRLVELWSFFFGTVLPYFEGVFLPLQQEISSTKFLNTLHQQLPNVRTMALKSFRDHVIYPMMERLEDVFAKLFIDFESGIPVTDTAARMLQMTSVLASILSDDQQQREVDRLLLRLKANWRKFMNRRDRRGFVGLKELRQPTTMISALGGAGGDGRIFGP
ncbi:uncharacterized protein VTP21DRAFT_10130 [Calcarisporiella thermophila]|uniref:uncharacterized protein n=1 Tax=Calcarisporiella thermophila TaxID=911321 RepID=UPI0037431F85